MPDNAQQSGFEKWVAESEQPYDLTRYEGHRFNIAYLDGRTNEAFDNYTAGWNARGKAVREIVEAYYLEHNGLTNVDKLALLAHIEESDHA